MSLTSIAQQFRDVVMGEFVLFCQKSPGAIDLEMLTALITEFSGEPFRTTTVPEEVKGKAKRAKKAKKSEEESCDFCRMPEPDPEKCMSRSFGKGCGTQCTRKSKDGDYCGMHAKQLSESGDPPFGRIDEPRHLLKRGDETKECGWKHFKDDGAGVEDTSEEAVGVGANEDIQSVAEKMVESDLEIESPASAATQESMDLAPVPMAPVTKDSPEDKAPVTTSPEDKAPVTESHPPVQEGGHSVDSEEDPDVDPNIDAPGPAATQEDKAPVTEAPVAEAPVPESKTLVAEAPVPEDNAPVPEDNAPVPEDNAPVPESKTLVAEAPVAEAPVAEDNAIPESDRSDTEEDDNLSDTRTGSYQGVEYVFDSAGDKCVVKTFNKKTYQLKEVGIYNEDEDEIEFYKKYQSTHETRIPDLENEDQEGVQWK
jgi:hypothetical protein